MKNTSWTEKEIKDTIKWYFYILNKQDNGEKINKTEIYKRLASSHKTRSAKSFELKFQNISAILFEEKMPFIDGLPPRSNYQRLLKLLVLDYLDKNHKYKVMPIEILTNKLKSLYSMANLQVSHLGSGKYGLTIEKYLGIQQNSSKNADFMGIEIKTKNDKSLQTLFSLVPSEYAGGKCRNQGDLIDNFGYHDNKRNRQALYTSFSKEKDSLGFFLNSCENAIEVWKDNTKLLIYKHQDLEKSLFTKHTETVYIYLSSIKKENNNTVNIQSAIYCKHPSILKFLDLIKAGKIYLDFTISKDDNKIKNHGFLWRINSESIQDLYLMAEKIELEK